MRNKYAIESVDNALQLIMILQSDGSLRLSRAADELGVARSTAHRLLGTLVDRGFAMQDEQRRYVPGPSLTTTLDRRGAAPGRLRLMARRHLRLLTKESNETTHLLVREGVRVRFLDSVEGAHPLSVGSRVGMVLPAHITSGGKALLADIGRPGLDRLYQHELDGPEVDQLVRTLTTVLHIGYGTNIGGTERGVSAVGARVRNAEGRAVAALTISAPSIRLSQSRIPEMANLLLEAVDRLERHLAAIGTSGGHS